MRSKPARLGSPVSISGLKNSSAAPASAPTRLPKRVIQTYFIARLASAGRVRHRTKLDRAFQLPALADAGHDPAFAVAPLERLELAAAADYFAAAFAVGELDRRLAAPRAARLAAGRGDRRIDGPR